MEDKSPRKLPFVLQRLRNSLVEGIRMIDAGECDEASAIAAASRYNSESRGFYDKYSVVNYDEAAEILGVRNRNNLKDLCKVHGIEQVKLKGTKIGFLRSQIEDLANQLRKQNRGEE